MISIACISFAAVLIIVIILFLANHTPVFDPSSVSRDDISTEPGEEDSDANDHEISYEKLWSDVPNEIKAEKPNASDENISTVEYADNEIHFIQTLIDSGYIEQAGLELESLEFTREFYPENFDSCRLTELYRVRVAYSKKLDDKETAAADEQEMNKYAELCYAGQ